MLYVDVNLIVFEFNYNKDKIYNVRMVLRRNNLPLRENFQNSASVCSATKKVLYIIWNLRVTWVDTGYVVNILHLE